MDIAYVIPIFYFFFICILNKEYLMHMKTFIKLKIYHLIARSHIFKPFIPFTTSYTA